ncbi:left-right determination factor 2 [Sarcophilus harrisii]|uniref:Left-right determination factor n=1 Tax=Sarcophilus harrisii TaxID=9305 RepID=G3WNF0_SARHA|nr:left-right determination factor 2 [Sarcophilus harrisii]
MRFPALTWAVWALLLASSRAMQIEEKIQESLMKQLNLNDIPVLEKTDVEKLVIPDHVRTKYISLLKRSSEETFSRGKRHTQATAEIMGNFFSDASSQLLVFSMNDRLSPTGELAQAVLRLFQKPCPKEVIKRQSKMFPFNSHASVTIYWVQTREDGINRTYVIDSRRVSIHETGWISFDVTQAVSYWQQQNKTDQPLVLEVSVHRENIGPMASNAHKFISFSSQNPADGELHAPQLQLHTLDTKEYGAQGNCIPNMPLTKITRCCRSETYINLQNLKWAENWILDPPGFKTYTCVGSCQQLKKEHLNFKWPFSMQRKCFAAKSAHLPLIVAVKDGDSIVTKVVTLYNMKVLECGCASVGMPIMKKLKP